MLTFLLTRRFRGRHDRPQPRDATSASWLGFEALSAASMFGCPVPPSAAPAVDGAGRAIRRALRHVAGRR